MDAVVEKKKPVAINRWLPYWAVFQYDVGQTLRSWVYRVWVLAVLLVVTGFLLYRFGLAQEAGYEQQASNLFSNLLQGAVLGSVAFVVVLTGGSISSERGTLADSVLSRGISRYQYFLGKWHARLAVVLVTYTALSLLALAGSLMFHEDVTPDGGLVALTTIGALLATVVTVGVAVSAVSNNTLLVVAGLWVVLYGGGLALDLTWMRKLLPNSPAAVLDRLPNILCSHYDLEALAGLMGWSVAVSLAAALAGMVCFARRDV